MVTQSNILFFFLNFLCVYLAIPKSWFSTQISNPGHTKSWFSTQISNPGPLIWEHKSLSHWSTSEIPTPVFLPAESHGQRSLVGYSPWGLKEWDTTEWTEHARAHTCYLPGLCFIKSHLKRRKWEPTPVLLPGESHVQRSLVHRGA